MRLMSHPLRILHTTMRRRGWNGECSHTLVLCKELSRRGHEVTIAAPEASPLVERAKDEGIATWPHFSVQKGFHPVDFHRMGRRLSGFISKTQFDILHTHGSLDTWGGVYASRLAHPRPLVFRTRHSTLPIATHPLNRLLYRRWCDQIVAVSEAVADVIVGRGLLPRARVEVVRNGIDVGRFDPRKARGSLRRELDIPDDAPVVGDVARLSLRKGDEDFVRAAGLISQRFPACHFLFVGPGVRGEHLMGLARSMGIGDRLHLPGLVEDVPRVLATFDVFLHCSWKEAFCLATLEAMAMKRPVVATSVGGTIELIEDGNNGLLIPSQAPEAAAGAVCKLLENPELAAELAEAGHRLVTSVYSAERAAELVEKVYYEALVRNGKSPTADEGDA